MANKLVTPKEVKGYIRKLLKKHGLYGRVANIDTKGSLEPLRPTDDMFKGGMGG